MRGRFNVKRHDAGPLPHTSPLGRERIILSGDFDWHSGA